VAQKICVAEFDPPPLLESILLQDMVGLREEKCFIEKSFITKSGGGLIRTIIFLSRFALRKMMCSLREAAW